MLGRARHDGERPLEPPAGTRNALQKRGFDFVFVEIRIGFPLVVQQSKKRTVRKNFQQSFGYAFRAAVLDQVIVDESDVHGMGDNMGKRMMRFLPLALFAV